jgi:hypothetical protein
MWAVRMEDRRRRVFTIHLDSGQGSSENVCREVPCDPDTSKATPVLSACAISLFLHVCVFLEFSPLPVSGHTKNPIT